MGKEQKILEELIGSKPEKLTGEAKRLFEAIMKIADERDELLKEKQADKDKMIDLMTNLIYNWDAFRNYGSRKDIKQYFENLAKESGEIDEGR